MPSERTEIERVALATSGSLMSDNRALRATVREQMSENKQLRAIVREQTRELRQLRAIVRDQTRETRTLRRELCTMRTDRHALTEGVSPWVHLPYYGVVS